MGYYSAGGWSAPDFTAAPSAFNVATAGRGVAAAGGPALQAAAHGGEAPRRKTRVLNLSALSRAFTRIGRATKLAHRLFKVQKSGMHGVKPKSRRKK